MRRRKAQKDRGDAPSRPSLLRRVARRNGQPIPSGSRGRRQNGMRRRRLLGAPTEGVSAPGLRPASSATTSRKTGE